MTTRFPTRHLKIGDVVILTDDSLPTRWTMARIVDVHPGPDGIVRVVTLRTVSSEFKRSISKICPMPSD